MIYKVEFIKHLYILLSRAVYDYYKRECDILSGFDLDWFKMSIFIYYFVCRIVIYTYTCYI